MKKTLTGLADLVRAFEALNPARSEWAAIARLLGLKGDMVIGDDSDIPQSDDQTTLSGFTELVAIANVPEIEAYEPFPRAHRLPPRSGGWQYEPRVEPPGPDETALPVRLTEVKPPPTGEMPSYVVNAEELDFHSRTHRHLPAAEPLVPVGQLRALIAHLIAAPVPGDPDISQLVDGLARGRLPRVLPREKRRGTAHRLHVLLDTAGSLRLFQGDAFELITALRDVAGPAIVSEEVTHGPPPAELRSRAAPGDTVLIVSDFGIGSRPLVKRLELAGWRKFSVSQHRRGIHLTAVVPFHHHRWPVILKRRIRMVHWHRLGSAATPATPRQLHRLAQVLSLAAVIDPAFLRLARMRILPGADAGVEADFANGPWTAACNPRVIALFPGWTAQLRSELAQDPDLLEAARRLLENERPRTNDWDRVLFEEKVIYFSLQSDSPDHLKNALARVIRSLWAECAIRSQRAGRFALSRN